VFALMLSVSVATFAATKPITIDYPGEGSIFPVDFPAPTVIWRDATSGATSWSVEVRAGNAVVVRAKARGERMRIGQIDPRAVGVTNKLPMLTCCW
jgi:hypothetical protein